MGRKKNQINIKSINKNANQLQSKVPDIKRKKVELPKTDDKLLMKICVKRPLIMHKKKYVKKDVSGGIGFQK